MNEVIKPVMMNIIDLPVIATCKVCGCRLTIVDEFIGSKGNFRCIKHELEKKSFRFALKNEELENA